MIYISVILDFNLYSKAKRKKKEEAANAKILEAEKRIKVCLQMKLLEKIWKTVIYLYLFIHLSSKILFIELYNSFTVLWGFSICLYLYFSRY